VLKREGSLDRIRVAAPCPASWEHMEGTDEVRFCGQCRLRVYNISSMTRPEALRLILGAEGRLCVKFYRRPDGTVITSNCPKGLRALGRRIAKLSGAVLAAILSAPSWVAGADASPLMRERAARHSADRPGWGKKPGRVRRRRPVPTTIGAPEFVVMPAEVPVIPPPVQSVPTSPVKVETDVPPPQPPEQ
jgi:hypothetical protein